MKKFVPVLLMMLLLVSIAHSQSPITKLWENSVAAGTLPAWFSPSGNTERGFAYGVVGGKERIYVVSRNAGLFVRIIDAATGAAADIDTLKIDKTVVTGGTFALNDIEVSDDGVIFGCNLTLNSSTSALKVYRWNSDTSSAIVVFNSTTSSAYRYGDKMTVVGSTADNSIIIYFAAAQASGGPEPKHVLKLTTLDNGLTFTATEIPIAEKSGASPAVGPVGLGLASLYINSNGNNAKLFDVATGNKIGEIPGSILGTGSNAIRYIEAAKRKYVVSYQYGSTKENARVVDVSNGEANAESFIETPQLGMNANSNGTGDIAIKDLGAGKFVVYVLSTNNGFGAYEINANYLKGIYYVGAPGTAPGGADPHYPSLKAACDDLNQKMILGNCTFYITSDLTEATNVALGVNPDPYTITFKPYSGVTPTITFTQSTDAPSAGISGAWVIGTKDLATTAQLVTTNNIIIDGSNTENGTTRDMMITTAAGAHGNATTLRLIGDVNHSIVKNVKVWAQQSVTYALLLTYRYDASQAKFYTADSVTVENCEITNTVKSSAQALAISTYGTPPAGTPLVSMKGIVFKNNTITAKTRGIFLNYAGCTDIIGNDINVIQTNTGFMSLGIFGFNITDTTDVINIYNNKITLLSTANNNAGDYGIIGIQCGGRGTYNVFNNFITGFDATSTTPNPNFNLIGIRLATDKVISNVFHNTIHMNNVAIDPGSGVVLYAGIQISNGINTVKNNIIFDGEDDFKTHAIYRSGTLGTLTADYNNYYLAGTVNAKTGYWDTADAATLADWRSVSGGDAHSVAKPVEFVSATDLHLAGASIGDINLAGTPLVEVPFDIDGQPRSSVLPYMGADEGDIELQPKAFITIAEARIDADGDFYPDRKGDTVTVRGIVASPNYGSRCQYYFQDETGGIVLYSGTVSISLNYGDEIEAKGAVDFYRGVTEIVPAKASDVKVISSGNVVVPKKIKIADLGEQYEAQLVQVDSVRFIDLSKWPAAGSNGSVYLTDGKDTTYIYIDKETDLDGWTPPSGLLTIIAQSDQYTSSASVYNDGYSLRGTLREHFIELVTPPPPPEKLFPMWAKTQAAGNFPAYMSTSNYTRGMAYGKVNGADRVYVVTRFGEHRTVIYDALSGDSLGVIPKPPQAEGVGLFHLNAIDVSEDGIIFVSNMSLSSDATSPFRVYSWKSETDVAATAISYDAALGRMGDMISVYGKASDNSLVIYAGVANSDKFVKFTTADNGQTFTATVVTLPSGKLGTVPNIAQTKDGHLYIKSYGNPLFRFNPATNVMDTVSTTIVGTGATKIKYYATDNGEFLVIYYPDVPGAGGAERIDVLDITGGPKKAFVKYFSSSIGKTPNGNGTGSVDVMKVSEDTQLFFILGTNNGVAAFSNNSQFVVAELDTLFYGNTPVLHKNPYGSGFIVGTNSYGDIGKYQWFDLKARDVLHGFKFYFAFKRIVNEPDTIRLVVKTVQPNGAPGETIAEVKTTTDVLDTTKMGNVFFLENPLPLTGLIFIGFEWSTTTDDEFALFADANGEGDKANRVWEKFSDGQYNDFTNPTYSWGLDTDLWIEAYYRKAAPTDVDQAAGVGLPKDYVLKQNYPNPFNPSTTIELAVPENADVEIAVYNILGQKVADVFKGKLNAGYHKFDFTATNLSSGIYLYKVKANHFESVKKMTILK